MLSFSIRRLAAASGSVRWGAAKLRLVTAYIKGPKRQFFLHIFTIFFNDFLVPREAALAADLITA